MDDDRLADNSSLDAFRYPGHSYRNFVPADLTELLENTDRKTALAGVRFIESTRFEPMVIAADELVAGLHPEDRPKWIARNPDLTEYVVAYRLIRDGGVDSSLADQAAAHLTADRYSAKNVPTFPTAVPGSRYGQQNPFRLREQHDDLEDKRDLRQLLDRLERDVSDIPGPGRLKTLADDGLFMFARLDPDEKRMFARRNPGLTAWMSLYGWSEDLINQDDLYGEWPPMPTDSEFQETFTPSR